MKKEFSYVADRSYPESDPPSSGAKAEPSLLPRSLEMFGDILTLIAAQKFGVDMYEIGHAIYLHDDGSFGIGFTGFHEEFADERGFKDPDELAALYNMLCDLRVVAEDQALRINPDNLQLYCASKVALHRAICELIETDDYDLDTVDNIILMEDTGPAAPALIHNMRQDPSRFAEIFLQPGCAEYDPENNQHNVFVACPPSHGFGSREEFYVNMMRAQEADIPLSLDHLLRVIWEEDKSSNYALTRDAYIVGGYH